MWFDFSYPKPDGSGKGRKDWEIEKLYKLVRELQPNIILDDRLDMDDGWDIKTPEQFPPRGWVKYKGTAGGLGGLPDVLRLVGLSPRRDTWKSVTQLVQMLVDTVSKGGNLLLNVGPDRPRRVRLPRARAPARAWASGCSSTAARSMAARPPRPRSPRPQDCRLTYNPEKKRLYVHVFAWPFKYLYLDGLAGKVEYAQLLHDGSEIGLKATDWTAGQAKEHGGRQGHADAAAAHAASRRDRAGDRAVPEVAASGEMRSSDPSQTSHWPVRHCIFIGLHELGNLGASRQLFRRIGLDEFLSSQD